NSCSHFLDGRRRGVVLCSGLSFYLIGGSYSPLPREFPPVSGQERTEFSWMIRLSAERPSLSLYRSAKHFLRTGSDFSVPCLTVRPLPALFPVPVPQSAGRTLSRLHPGSEIIVPSHPAIPPAPVQTGLPFRPNTSRGIPPLSVLL